MGMLWLSLGIGLYLSISALDLYRKGSSMLKITE